MMSQSRSACRPQKRRARRTAVRARGACLPFWLELDPLHAVVVAVQHVDPAVAVAGQGPGVVELAWLPAVSAPTAERFSVAGKFLHATVAVFDNVQLVVAAERQAVGIAQLARCVPRRAP